MSAAQAEGLYYIMYIWHHQWFFTTAILSQGKGRVDRRMPSDRDSHVSTQMVLDPIFTSQTFLTTPMCEVQLPFCPLPLAPQSENEMGRPWCMDMVESTRYGDYHDVGLWLNTNERKHLQQLDLVGLGFALYASYYFIISNTGWCFFSLCLCFCLWLLMCVMLGCSLPSVPFAMLCWA